MAKIFQSKNKIQEKNIDLDILNKCIYNYYPDGELYLFEDGASIIYLDNEYTYQKEKDIIDIQRIW